jgi:ATP-dependent Clp protease ATP-binding subunit ClpA
MFERYSDLAHLAIFFARKEAGETGAASIDTEHLLIGILSVDPELPNQLGIDLDARSISNQCKQLSLPGPAIADTVEMTITTDLGRVFAHAISVADVRQCREIRTEHLVASLFEHGGHAAKILADFRLEEKTITSLLTMID